MDLLDPAPLPVEIYQWLLAQPKQTGAGPNKLPSAAVKSVRLNNVRQRPIEWLWPGWLPLGKLCDLCGDPGLSKSTLLLDLAARVSSKGIMPDGTQGITGGVCIMSAEDGLEDTILPRLRAAGADLAKIGSLEEHNSKPLLVPDHLGPIENRLRELDARLLVIDPLMAYMARSSSDRDIRQCLHPLKTLAERLRCTVVWLRHLGKGGPARAIHRASGHSAIGAAARAGLIVGADRDDSEVRVLAHAKSNLAPRQKSLTYRLEMVAEFDCCRLVWGERSEWTADDLCERVSEKEKYGREEAQSRLEEAVEFLKAALKDGPRACEELETEARALGLVWVTVRRALRGMRGMTLYPHQTASHKHEWALSVPNGGEGRSCAQS